MRLNHEYGKQSFVLNLFEDIKILSGFECRFHGLRSAFVTSVTKRDNGSGLNVTYCDGGSEMTW